MSHNDTKNQFTNIKNYMSLYVFIVFASLKILTLLLNSLIKKCLILFYHFLSL